MAERTNTAVTAQIDTTDSNMPRISVQHNNWQVIQDTACRLDLCWIFWVVFYPKCFQQCSNPEKYTSKSQMLKGITELSSCWSMPPNPVRLNDVDLISASIYLKRQIPRHSDLTCSMPPERHAVRLRPGWDPQREDADHDAAKVGQQMCCIRHDGQTASCVSTCGDERWRLQTVNRRTCVQQLRSEGLCTFYCDFLLNPHYKH